jgi:hypothetical protein
MKRKDLVMIIGIAFFTAIIAYILSSVVFKVSATRSTKVPITGTITTTLPDVQHDSTYNSIFFKGAVDPAVPLSASNAPNNQPFSPR